MAREKTSGNEADDSKGERKCITHVKGRVIEDRIGCGDEKTSRAGVEDAAEDTKHEQPEHTNGTVGVTSKENAREKKRPIKWDASQDVH